jgi:hypothetical protein
MRIEVFATTTFEGFHRWPEAPAEVAYLRDRHRHLFHVTARARVSHADRSIEFHELKHQVEAVIRRIQAEEDPETWSCERWAGTLVERCLLSSCQVSEDGENGAEVWR